MAQLRTPRGYEMSFLKRPGSSRWKQMQRARQLEGKQQRSGKQRKPYMQRICCSTRRPLSDKFGRRWE
eukprot:12400977-Karenia_brevis.AAC.1